MPFYRLRLNLTLWAQAADLPDAEARIQEHIRDRLAQTVFTRAYIHEVDADHVEELPASVADEIETYGVAEMPGDD